MAHSWDDPDESTGIYDPTRASIQPADERWFISRDRQAKEQLSAAQIIQLCQDGTVSEATLVWREGLSGWTPLGEVPELAQALRAFSKIPPMPRTGVTLDPRASLPSLPPRGSLPSLPPPPSLPAAARYGSTTTPPQRMSIGGRTPSVIINEGRSPVPLPAGRLLSMLKFPEPYSIQMPGARRVGVWTLVLGASTLLVSTALGAVLFAGESASSGAAAVELDLDQGSSTADTEPQLDSAGGPAPAAAAEVVTGRKPALPQVVDESPTEALEEAPPDTEPQAAGARRPASGTGDRNRATSKPKAAPSPAAGSGFDAAAANRALASAASRAGRCKPAGGPTGSGQVRVTYAPSGSVKSVSVVTAKFQGTTTGSCLQMVFRSAKVPPFTGGDATVTKGFSIQ